ncbi:MAG TPA: hypothetical protein PKY77_07590 [Phycisphaerae bacterium]|nr:hypothetical protein [Phycisphaerae bacterium]HRY67864.1 hypothetical protein [Phycisphaerae bacterium]HSA25317.1 hypothetical protein [Phycisphaerae bacterium]
MTHTQTTITGVILGSLLLNAGCASVVKRPLRWQVGEPIATYYAGPAVTDPVARQMKEGGFNLVWCSEQEMDTARRHGLRVLLRDALLCPQTLDDPAQVAKLDALIERVKNHPSLYAYWIIDQPGAALFPGLGRLVAHLRARDPAHMADINLFPTYANNDQLGVKGDTETAYREYLRQFIETVKPDLLSYDHYHFAVGHDTDQYFLNLGMIRRAALDAGIPFLNIVQGCTWDPGMRVPNGDEMRWLNYTSLAYGAQGLSYYVYSHAGHEGGMARADGTITPQYEAARVLNREFVAIAAQLLSLQSLGAYHVGKPYRGAEPLPASSPFRLDAEAPGQDLAPADGMLLGCFGKPGENGKPGRPTHTLVVNLNYRSEVRTAVTGPGPLEVFDPLRRAWKRTDGTRVTLALPPGGGVLFRAREVHSVNAAPSEYPSTDHF